MHRLVSLIDHVSNQELSDAVRGAIHVGELVGSEDCVIGPR